MNAKRQQGAALIIALVVVAMATVLASTLVWESHLERRRTALLVHGAEAQANALSVEDFVRVLLAEDAAQNDFDHLQEPWAQQGNIFPIEGGSLQGAVLDLQSRFNVNNLVNWTGDTENQDGIEKQREAYASLISSLGLDRNLVAQTIDWLDPDQNADLNGGAEDDTYLRHTPAYRTANGPIADISELRLLEGMTPEQFAALAPYVTALPTTEITKININTAPPELISAIDTEISPDAAVRIVDVRSQEGIADLENINEVAGTAIDGELFDVRSNWFRLNVLAVVGSSRVSMYSVLRRDTESNAVLVESRSLGTP